MRHSRVVAWEDEMGVKLKQDDSGWWQITDYPPLPGTAIWIRFAIIKSEPRVIALNIEPLRDSDGDSIALTSALLRSLPLKQWAILCQAATNYTHNPHLRGAMKTSRRQAPDESRQRAFSPNEVAEVWHAAFRGDTGKPPRQSVADHFVISKRTADRYIQNARKEGLITEYMRPQVAAAAKARGALTTPRPLPSSQKDGEGNGRQKA